MVKIFSYIKYVSTDITRTIALPVVDNQIVGTELATLGNLTYISIPDDADFPQNQPAEIVNTISEVTLTSELREQIKAASTHCNLINQRVIEKIREKYSADDESAMQNKMIAHLAGTEILNEADLQKIRDAYMYFNECRLDGKSKITALLG